MKLVHVATSARFWPFLAGQVAFMKARGFEVHAVSAGGRTLDEFAAQEGIRAWTVPMSRDFSPGADLLALWRLWRLFSRLRPQVVHAHTAKAGLLAMLAARAARVPARLYTIHGLVWRTRRGWRKRLLIALERLTCRSAHRALGVSESIRQGALSAGLAPPEKILVAGRGSANGLDFEKFNPCRLDPETAARYRRRYGIPETAPILGFVGRLVPDKGIAELATAWAELRRQFPALHLVLAGETEDHDPLPALLRARFELDPRVHLAGWAPDMPEHYRLLDVCVLPSRREGLPYAALEAAAMERPVVAFAVEGMVDAVESGETGLLVEPGNAAALASAVARLFEDPELSRRLGRQARLRTQALYQQEPLWEHIYQQYQVVLRAAPAGPGRPLWWKRPLDLALALTALLALGPLITLVALAVLVDLGLPVLYRQRRLGFRERVFEILKFRTMRDASSLPDRQRLTRLGRFLRLSSLDELPQLFNILRGQMSFIGPRPLLERYAGCYTPVERRRHLLRPGLTGWAQIHGRNDLAWDRRLQMDVWYVDYVSWRLDARIAFQTVWKMLTGQGVREDPRSSMPDLDAERQRA